MLSLSDVWPLFDLELRSPRLSLRPVRDEDIPGLADAALAGIHDPAVMPFGVPWTDASAEDLPRNIALYQWSLRGRVHRDDWVIPFVVRHEGTVIGAQDVSGTEFGATRTVQTGSWLTSSAQGRGLGKEMRAAVLLFAFDYLGAEVAETSAAAWNEASIGVTTSLGYEPNGVHRATRRPGQGNDEVHFRVPSERFVRPDWSLDVHGLDRAKTQLLGH
jgi:RimJ/RimL family protein N-acetyltransferase